MKLLFIPLFFFMILLFGCKRDSISQKNDFDFWEQFEVVGSYEVMGNDTVLICDISKIKQYSSLPIDLVVEDINILLMDEHNEDAFIGSRLAISYISENYIAVAEEGNNPVKLFNKKGVFLKHIGSIGQGPGEYTSTLRLQLDETNNRIYILSFNTGQILVYDFDGNWYSSIPVADWIHSEGNFFVRPETEEIVIFNPSNGSNKHLVYIQDFAGNVKHGLLVDDYYEDLGNTIAGGITTGFRSGEMDYYNLELNNENKYFNHYDIANNVLKPVFKLKNPGEWSYILIHELPNQYVIERPQNMGFNNNIDPSAKIIIDKKTLRGFYFMGFEMPSGLILDNYGMFFRMTGPYFRFMDFGSEFLSKVNAVNPYRLSNQQKKELAELKQLLESKNKDDDTSWLIYGAFKQ